MTDLWRKIHRTVLSGPLFVLIVSALVLVVILLTGGPASDFHSLLYLPVILAVVRCSFEFAVGIGLLLSALSLVSMTGGGLMFTREDVAHALSLNTAALIGAFYARRVQRERNALQHTVEEKEALLNASQVVNSADKLEDALNRALLMLRAVFPPFLSAAIFLVDDTQRNMELAAVLNADPGNLRFERFGLADEGVGWSPDDPQPLYIPDTTRDCQARIAEMDARARSVVCLALRSLRVPIGLLYVSSDQPDSFTPAQIDLLRAFADRIGFPLQKIRIQEGLQGLAFTDGMTGLYNFRSFRAHLEDEIKRSARYKRSLSLILLDIDGFKGINDRYGHPSGDKMLVGIAGVVRSTIRETDVPARYGGEEFAVICPETAGPEAAVVAERIRRAVEMARFQLVPEESCAVTVSLGVATYPQGADDDSALIRAADEALYRAKRAGKNQVVVIGSASLPSESP